MAQRGSLNADDRLRFDFPRGALSLDDIAEVEPRKCLHHRTRLSKPASAQTMPAPSGAQALFGEKYGDEVRVVSMDAAIRAKAPMATRRSNSAGTCAPDQDIGLFVTLGDSASSAGADRATGEAARAFGRTGGQLEVSLTRRLRPVNAREGAADERKASPQVADLRKQLALAGGRASMARRGCGRRTADRPGRAGGLERPAGLIDAYKGQLGSGAVLLIADTGGKAAVAAGVTDDLTDACRG